jgi:enamine deaminase RidA (YjgF/YER057c/UK114 family)
LANLPLKKLFPLHKSAKHAGEFLCHEGIEPMTITRIQPGKRMSQAVVYGPTVYLAGQVADDATASITEQTKQVLAKVDALLAAAGTSKANVLSIQVLLANIADFAAMNSVYDTWIDPANTAARATFEARLADPSLRVEIVVIAAVPN